MSMVGMAVPLILVPRFTGYVGAGTYATAPLDVTAYARAFVTLWRGPLVGDPGDGALFECWFEGSHDAQQWTRIVPMPPSPVITTVDTSSDEEIPLTRHWMRVVIRLTADSAFAVGITCFAAGLLERRIE